MSKIQTLPNSTPAPGDVIYVNRGASDNNGKVKVQYCMPKTVFRLWSIRSAKGLGSVRTHSRRKVCR
jgi:hypothetical protein